MNDRAAAPTWRLPAIPRVLLSRLVGLQAFFGLGIAAGNELGPGLPGWTIGGLVLTLLSVGNPGIWRQGWSTAWTLRWQSLATVAATLAALQYSPDHLEVLVLAAAFVPVLEIGASLYERSRLSALPLAALVGWLLGRAMLPGPTQYTMLAGVLVLAAVQLHLSTISRGLVETTQTPPPPLEPPSQLLNRIFDATGDGWWLLDTQTGEIEWSSLALRLLGGRLATGRLPEIDDLVAAHPKAERELVRERLRRVGLGAPRTRWEGPLRQADGSFLHISWTALGWPEVGRHRRVLGVITDKTEQVEVHADLRRTASALDALLEHAPVVLSRIRSDGAVTEIRGRGLERLHAEEEIDGAVLRDTDARLAARLERALAGELVEYRTSGSDAGQGWCFRTFLFPDRLGEGVISVSIDTTETWVLEQHLRASERRFLLAVRGSAAGIWDFDIERSSLYLSSRISEILCVPEPELTLDGLRARHPEVMEALIGAATRHLQDRVPFEVELPMQTDRERPIWIYVRGEATWTPTGEPIRMAGSVMDVTARHEAQTRLEEEARRAEAASHAKTLFLANMSHELRTPMNAIVGMAQLLKQTSLDVIQRDYCQIITTSSEDLLTLIDDVLDISKIEQGTLSLTPREMSIPLLCKDVVGRLEGAAQGRGLALDLVIEDAEGSFVLGDPVRFRQIVINLVSNAIKFTDSGQVHILLRGQELGEERRGYVLEVRDTGQGIAPEDLERIFESFVQVDPSMTRRQGGSGLGLAIVKHIVHLMEGDISATSQLGKGSTFRVEVELPVVSGPERTIAIEETAELEQPARILVAEDNLVNQRVIKRMLDLLGVDSTVVDNGQAALDALTLDRFDLVLMDVQMPVLDGHAATRALRAQERGEHMPIVALTAHATLADRDLCFEAGMDGYLSKPVRLELLRSEIARHLAEHP